MTATGSHVVLGFGDEMNAVHQQKPKLLLADIPCKPHCIFSECSENANKISHLVTC